VTITKEEEVVTCDYCGKDTIRYSTCGVCGRQFCPDCFSSPLKSDKDKLEKMHKDISVNPCRYCMKEFDWFAPTVIEMFRLSKESCDEAFAAIKRWGKASRPKED
jgi:hypothetical protein